MCFFFRYIISFIWGSDDMLTVWASRYVFIFFKFVIFFMCNFFCPYMVQFMVLWLAEPEPNHLEPEPRVQFMVLKISRTELTVQFKVQRKSWKNQTEPN